MPSTSPSDERTCDTTTLLRHSLPLSLPPDCSLLLFILFFFLLGDHHPSACSGLRRALTPSIPLFLFFLLLFRLLSSQTPTPTQSFLTSFSRMFLIMPELVPLRRTLSGNRMSRARNGDAISDGMLTIKI